jgi:translation initiation factor IF-1
MNENQKENTTTVSGVVIEALPNTFFKVELADGKEMLTYLSGRMRKNRIRVLVGDKVEVVTDSYGSKGRVVKRL